MINNSFAAMQDGGHLEVTVRRFKQDMVSVTITDDGCGIPKADLERVFEPFFSTRAGRAEPGSAFPLPPAWFRNWVETFA